MLRIHPTLPFAIPTRAALVQRAVVISAAVVLAACGNAYESLSVGEWEEVGTSQPPASALAGNLTVRKIRDGRGQTVRPGDLVRIRVTATSGRLWHSHISERELTQTHTLWLWTGREPEGRDRVLAWGDLGSARLRAALIGRAIYDRLEVRLRPDAEPPVTLPLNGFWTEQLKLPNSWRGESTQWPTISFSNDVTAEVEILDACPVRLYRRSATIVQLGFILNMFGDNYDPVRKGTLRWSALEGECGPAGRRTRVEIGPLYAAKYPEHGLLYDWVGAYEALSYRVPPFRIGITWLILAFVPVAWVFGRSRSVIVRLALVSVGALLLFIPAADAKMTGVWTLLALGGAVWAFWPIRPKPTRGESDA